MVNFEFIECPLRQTRIIPPNLRKIRLNKHDTSTPSQFSSGLRWKTCKRFVDINNMVMKFEITPGKKTTFTVPKMFFDALTKNNEPKNRYVEVYRYIPNNSTILIFQNKEYIPMFYKMYDKNWEVIKP